MAGAEASETFGDDDDKEEEEEAEEEEEDEEEEEEGSGICATEGSMFSFGRLGEVAELCTEVRERSSCAFSRTDSTFSTASEAASGGAADTLLLVGI